MLDTGFHPAAGLNNFTPQAQLRVLAVASQERASSGLEMLWQICANLQRLGYPVAVLDGTALETDESPASAICCKPWNDGLNASASVTSVAVLPLPGACSSCNARPTARAHRLCIPLQPLFPRLRHAGAARAWGLLAPLLTHTSTIPLAVMEGGSAGCSLATKPQAHRHAHGLPCTVASVLQTDTPAERRKVLGALQTCRTAPTVIWAGACAPPPCRPITPTTFNALALQLLENAGTINGPLGTLSILSAV